VKPKYKMEKRQKELARQQKKEKKKAEKLARKGGPGDEASNDEPEPAAADAAPDQVVPTEPSTDPVGS
jgi:hypothetical protein